MLVRPPAHRRTIGAQRASMRPPAANGCELIIRGRRLAVSIASPAVSYAIGLKRASVESSAADIYEIFTRFRRLTVVVDSQADIGMGSQGASMGSAAAKRSKSFTGQP